MILAVSQLKFNNTLPSNKSNQLTQTIFPKTDKVTFSARYFSQQQLDECTKKIALHGAGISMQFSSLGGYIASFVFKGCSRPSLYKDMLEDLGKTLKLEEKITQKIISEMDLENINYPTPPFDIAHYPIVGSVFISKASKT
jgi:hypothetical protein